MADILMTYSSLESAAGKINQAQANLEDITTALDSAVSALEGSWSGQAYQAFVNAWQESKPTMQRLAAAVGNFAPELNSAVSTQQQVDNKIATGMGNLAF